MSPDEHAWTDEQARKFTAPCADRHQWDAWLAAHDARVRRDAAREALGRAGHRIARMEAQTSIRGRAVVMYRERAREAEARIKHLEDTARVLVKETLHAEAERDSARGYISELETAVQSRNDVIKHRDARIKAVRDVLDQAEASINRHPAYTFSGQRMDPIVNGADIRRALEGSATRNAPG